MSEGFSEALNVILSVTIALPKWRVFFSIEKAQQKQELGADSFGA